MDEDVFNAAVEDIWEDELIEAVVAQTHYQKKMCWFYPRVPCKNGDDCEFRHEDRDGEKIRKQKLDKWRSTKKQKKEKKPLKIELKDDEPQEEVVEPVAEPAGLGPEGGESGSGI